jgi:hypothetical protein
VVTVYWKLLARGGGRLADLAGRGLEVLLAHRVGHIAGGEARLARRSGLSQSRMP